MCGPRALKMKESVAVDEIELIYSKTISRLRSQDVGSNSGFTLSLFAQEELGAHWFPAFLRRQKFPAGIFELAHFEWLVYELKQQVETIQKEDNVRGVRPAGLSLNPRVRWLHFSSPQPALQLKEGLYFLLYDLGQVTFREMSPLEAYVLDLLSENLNLELKHLIALLKQEVIFSELSLSQLEQQVLKMQDQGVLRVSS